MSIKIPRSVIAELIAHSLEIDPDECCGFLIGNDTEVTRMQRMENIDENARSRFTMDGLAVTELDRQVSDNGESFVAVYHSHTYMQAHPSPTDVDRVTEWSWAPYHVLVSLVEKTRPVVRAFEIHPDRTVVEVFITTDGESYTTAKS